MPLANLINSCETCTHGWEGFRLLQADEMRLLNDNRYEAAFKPGEIMIKQGSPTSSALFISEGMAKMYIEGNRGKNFLMGIATPGKLIMGPGAFVDSRHTYSVSAITQVHACFISFDVFRKVVRENPDFAEGLIEDISRKALKAHTRMVNLVQKRMSGRLADAILYFADEVFGSDQFEMLLSRQDLGDMTSMAKECVVRILREFEESAVVFSDASSMKILNKEKLRQISEMG